LNQVQTRKETTSTLIIRLTSYLFLLDAGACCLALLIGRFDRFEGIIYTVLFIIGYRTFDTAYHLRMGTFYKKEVIA